MKHHIMVLIILTPLFGLGQTLIHGTVHDMNGGPLAGVNIVLRGTYDGASSGSEGSFQFATQEIGIQTLVATYVGFVPFEKYVALDGNEISLDVVLEDEISQLDAVVISAGSFTAGDEKRRTILKPIDIATTAGATADIAGALNTLPGTQKVGESGRLFVRGGDGTEARTFVDGMVVLNPYGPSAPNTPSRGRFLPFMFKGTSFSTGGYSAEYGQALSSALVLNSKDKAEINQTDVGLLSVGADVAQTQVWDKGSVSGKMQYTNLEPYMSLINQRVDWINPPVSLEATTAFRQEVGKGMLKVFGTMSQNDFSLFNHAILNPDLKQRLDLSNRYRYGNLTFHTALDANWDLRSGLSYSYNQNRVNSDGLPAVETEQGTHAKIVAERAVSDYASLNIGFEVIQRRYEASRLEDSTRKVLALSFHETIMVGFTEAEVFFTKRFVAKLGLRFENNSLNQQFGIDPRVSLAYKPGKAGQVAFAYGLFRQSPGNQYLGLYHRLAQERAEHFILNYQVASDRKTFRVEAYWKRYSDLIRFFQDDATHPVNTGSGYARGVEVFWRDNQTFRNVDYWLSYSFLDTKRDYLNYPMAAVPTFASAHNFSFVYKHFIRAIKSQVGFTYSFASGRPYYNPNLASDLFQTERTPYYEDLSVNVSYLPRNWLIVYASCTNLLGRDNIFGYEYSTLRDANGMFAARAIRQPATHFLFLGVLITISKNKSINQLPNL